jgi:hypothetical protein
MAKSFAEAFQQAQASKDALAKTHLPVLNSDAAQAAQQLAPDHDLWAQQVAEVKPLARQTSTDVNAPTVPTALAKQHNSVPGAKPIALAAQPSRQPKNGRNPNLEEYHQRLARLKATQSRAIPSPARHPHLLVPRSASTVKPAGARNSVTLAVASEARVMWDGTIGLTASLLKHDLRLGTRTQISSDPTSTREVVLGFDFGTSSAKVVIGDRGLKKAHTVPFRDAIGIDAYLLPARLYEANESYSLHGGTRHFNDLKLALLADPDNLSLQSRAVAYLALAIREARAWLFVVHAEDYSKTNIVWTLALGLPAEHAVENSLSRVFAHVGTAAWAVAGHAVVSPDVCRKALEDAAAGSTDAEVEVTVTPEIAAQIYGFVNSSRFDAKARNFYLIADVGAGTVDACLFRVIPAKGGQWSFEIYTAAVEPSGVMNLHRRRVGWWQQHLAPDGVGTKLSKQLESIKLGTDNQAAIPASYEGYLSGVKVQFAGKAVDPDKEFFRRLVRQVQSRTLYRAFGDSLLGKQDIIDIPFLLCGGGARLSFYRNISDAIHRFEGCSWLSTKGQELVIPDDLRAEGVGRSDYDRLSVAYGLSMLSLANISTAQQIPKLPPESSAEQWRDHYVDKDLC